MSYRVAVFMVFFWGAQLVRSCALPSPWLASPEGVSVTSETPAAYVEAVTQVITQTVWRTSDPHENHATQAVVTTEDDIQSSGLSGHSDMVHPGLSTAERPSGVAISVTQGDEKSSPTQDVISQPRAEHSGSGAGGHSSASNKAGKTKVPEASAPGPTPSASTLIASQAQPNVRPSTVADAIFTDANVTVRLFIVDVGAISSEKGSANNSKTLFQPQAVVAHEGDTVLFRFHGPYALYLSDPKNPCHEQGLSQNAVSDTDSTSSYRFSVQSSEPTWFSANLPDTPFACDSRTLFFINPEN